MFKKKRIGLALGGGGARGLAHIGVLRVLEREQVPINLITGTSIGAIVGAMYAQNPSAVRIEEKFREFIQNSIFKKSGLEYLHNHHMPESWFSHVAEYLRERLVISIATHRHSAVGIERLNSTVAYLIEDGLIEHTKIPFAAVASDLSEGTDVVLSTGSIRDAVAASAALSGFLPPVDINGRLLVDGAATSPLPIRANKKLGAKKVIAIDVSQDLDTNPDLDHIIDFVLRSYSITAHRYHDEMVRETDVLLRPEVGHVHWSEFEEIDLLIAEGERAAEKKLEKIQGLCKRGLLEWMFAK